MLEFVDRRPTDVKHYHQLTAMVARADHRQSNLLRRLGDAAVVFDVRTWQTHVLPPAAAVVADLVDELSDDGPVTRARLESAVRTDLELDPHSAEMRDLFRMFEDIGLLGK